jgi:hypothetical protein
VEDDHDHQEVIGHPPGDEPARGRARTRDQEDDRERHEQDEEEIVEDQARDVAPRFQRSLHGHEVVQPSGRTKCQKFTAIFSRNRSGLRRMPRNAKSSAT